MAIAARRVRNRPDGNKRREHILDEAQRIIGERGYHGFGLQELAERCGMTRPGLLHHFGTKDGLLIEVLRRAEASHEDAVIKLLGYRHDPSAPPDEQRERFFATLRIIVERNVAQPELVRLQVILQAEAINQTHPAHHYFQAREAAKLELMTAYVAPFAAHPGSAARQIVALMNGLEAQWLREEMRFDLPTEFDRAMAMVACRDPDRH